MDEPSEANETPQSISADISTPPAVTSVESTAQNEAIKALPVETPHSVGITTPIEPTPQTEPDVPAPQMVAAPNTTVKARAAIQSKKRKKLDLILEEVRKNGSISNNEVEKLLGVSDATASRYLAALQKEGELKRLGSTGKAVRYEESRD